MSRLPTNDEPTNSIPINDDDGKKETSAPTKLPSLPRPTTRNHERGTPRSAAKYPYHILSLVLLACTGVSSWFLSSSDNSMVAIVIRCGLGVVSTTFGIFDLSPFRHAVALSIIVLLLSLLASSSSPPQQQQALATIITPPTTLLLLHLHLTKFQKHTPLLPTPPLLPSTLPYLLPLLLCVPPSSPVITGAYSILLLSTYLSLVASSLKVTTSGQFRMVGLDALAMLFYVFAPLVVLWRRFVTMYDVSPSSLILPLTKRGSLFSDVVLHGSAIVAGTYLLNAATPLSSHLLGMTYTRGQRYSARKNFAITCHLEDLLKKDRIKEGVDFDAARSRQEFGLLLRDLEETKSRLTVFVRPEEVESCKEEIEGLRRRDCVVGLLLDDVPGFIPVGEWKWFRCQRRIPSVVRWGCFEKKWKMCLWSFRGESMEDVMKYLGQETEGGNVIWMGSVEGIRGLVREFGEMAKRIDDVCLEDLSMDLE